MAAAVPLVERADHADALGIGRPDRKMRARHTFEFHRMGAKLVEQPQVAALPNIVVVHRPEHRPEAERVGDLPLPTRIAGPEADRLTLVDADAAFEEAALVPPLERTDGLAVAVEHGDFERVRDECPRDPAVVCLLNSKDRERIGVLPSDDRLYVLLPRPKRHL